MGPLAGLRRLDDRMIGAPERSASRDWTVLPYVLVGLVCAGAAMLAVVLSGGSLIVVAALPVLALLPPGIALLNRPVGGRHRSR